MCDLAAAVNVCWLRAGLRAVRIGLVHFQAGCSTSQLNLAFLVCYCVSVLVCGVQFLKYEGKTLAGKNLSEVTYRYLCVKGNVKSELSR